MTNNKLYQKAFDKFGGQHQITIAIEEYSEAIKELTKFQRKKGTMNNLAEELADAIIVTEQMIQLFGVQEMVDLWKEYKLARLEKTLDDK